ncbi:MAG: serine/threonine-protein kinase HipA [Psychrobacter glaciei]
MSFKNINKLNVLRTLTTGEQVEVGVLAQNLQGVFFQYHKEYIDKFGNLSPFNLDKNVQLQQAPRHPHGNIHGAFSDSLPDGWGLLLQDLVFRQEGMYPTQITAMDRLAFVGSHGLGGLSFTPVSDFSPKQHHEANLETLGLEAQALFDKPISEEIEGHTQQVLAALVAVGNSGGARPKAQVYMQTGDSKNCRTYAQAGDEAWIVKFTSKNLALGHEEGLCEAVYLQMAELAGCHPPSWQLIEAPKSSGAKAWLAVKRFDYLPAQVVQGKETQRAGRLHMQSACGLLDADYRSPSLDYDVLIRASRQLCKSTAAGQLVFRRAIFNLFASNQDDHSKNWGFLQDDDGSWNPAPFYDVTFSPNPFNGHVTSYGGHGNTPPLETIQQLAVRAGFASWKEARILIQEVVGAIDQFANLAGKQTISLRTVREIEKTLALRKKENAELLV